MLLLLLILATDCTVHPSVLLPMFTTQWFILKHIYSCQLCLQRAADTRDFLRCHDSFSASKTGPNECGCVRSEDVEELDPCCSWLHLLGPLT